MSIRYQTLISVDELAGLLGDDDIVILDIRFYLDDILKGRASYLHSHIPDAFYMDITHDLSSPMIPGVTGRHPLPHPEVLSSSLRSAGINTNSQVVVYDQSNGAYAARAWWLLRWLGHDNVAVLNGGFEAWKGINGPYDNQWPLPKHGNFRGTIQSEFVVDKKELSNLSGQLIDSRDYRRFSGEFEPIDPVAGHIPGAICLPFMANIREDSFWKSKEELLDNFAVIGNTSDLPVFYCGSGVTACHNILAYKIATGRDAALYAGSWSEWINYHDNPEIN